MRNEGPVLDRLTHRLSECPNDFLEEPAMGRSGKIRVSAVVNDTLSNLGGARVTPATLQQFLSTSASERNRLRLVLIACWLLNDRWFIQKRCFAEPSLNWLLEGLRGLAGLVDAALFVSDADRREELVRRCLAALGLRPEGESDTQADDRLTTLDSVERSKVIKDTLEKQKRARELREQMRRKEAAEAAAKVTRE